MSYWEFMRALWGPNADVWPDRRGGTGYWLVCCSCRTREQVSGLKTGRWYAWAHNASAAHRLAVTL